MGHRHWNCLHADRCRAALLAPHPGSIWIGADRSLLWNERPLPQPRGKHTGSTGTPRAFGNHIGSMGLCGIFINMPSIPSITLNTEQLQNLIQYVDTQMPLEACGLLAGQNAKVEKIFFIQNQAQSPIRFVMEPVEQLRAFEWIESNQMELLAIFHSHPSGPETVSATDVAEAAYDVIQVIFSHAKDTWKARAFWIEHGNFEEVELSII